MSDLSQNNGIGTTPVKEVSSSTSAARVEGDHATDKRALVTTPFNHTSTTDDVIRGLSLAGKRAIVTGSSGLGYETALALAKTGASVTVAAHQLDEGLKAAADITAATGNRQVDARALNLADSGSIAVFLDAWNEPLDILVNNAGIMAAPESYSRDGWELQFVTNYLGHFILTQGLHAALKEAAVAKGEARIVTVSSGAHMMSPVIFDDIHFAFRNYDPWLSYGQSKTACALLAIGANAHWGHENITANTLNPGNIKTHLQRYIGSSIDPPPGQLKTPQQGAATSVMLAVYPALKGIGGRYFNDCNEAEVLQRRSPGITGYGVAPYAISKDNAERLWNLGLKMREQTRRQIGLPPSE